MMKKNLLRIILLLGMCCLFFTSCETPNNGGDDDITDLTYTDVDWDGDLSWFVGTWKTAKIISQGVDITDCDTQEIEFSSDGKFVKWTSTLAGEIIPANTNFQDVKDTIKATFNIQVSEDKTNLKQTVSSGATSSYYYFTKK